MGCRCKARLRALLADVEENDKQMAEAASEGPYWVRMVASDFLKRHRERRKRIKCKCQAARRITTAFSFIRKRAVGAAVARRGGGSIEDRLMQNRAYAEFKRLLEDKPQEVRPVVVLLP